MEIESRSSKSSRSINKNLTKVNILKNEKKIFTDKCCVCLQ